MKPHSIYLAKKYLALYTALLRKEMIPGLRAYKRERACNSHSDSIDRGKKCYLKIVTPILGVQSNLGYPNSFVLRILYCVRISEFVQITEVVAKINRKRLV